MQLTWVVATVKSLQSLAHRPALKPAANDKALFCTSSVLPALPQKLFKTFNQSDKPQLAAPTNQKKIKTSRKQEVTASLANANKIS